MVQPAGFILTLADDDLETMFLNVLKGQLPSTKSNVVRMTLRIQSNVFNANIFAALQL